ncbi:flippase-like domain-containing protein [[Clostridium] innocuum]|nr:flippase-like domain-containing protein [Erysipelotrichaceae bacterium]MCR0381675.1 flippase-like domain-containing protein [[Clostridium] innocuum]MCR0413209.1 flippase-like domain-containing protein [[Clostridium] innocuum]MCR0533342.1 flippase-like domain-containing protein [[Clostridium] innocuum]MCR0537408.1 flippase-like domain-containing protein [[Clostridium] innocuum]
MKEWLKHTIKYVLLALFVAGMLYINIKDHAAEIIDTLQHLQLRYTFVLILLSASVYVIGGIGIYVLCRKVNPAYRMKSGISNSLISLFLMNVSASAVAKAAQMLLFKVKSISWEQGCSILVMDQLLYQISYMALSACAVFISCDLLIPLFPEESILALTGFVISIVPILAVALLFLCPGVFTGLRKGIGFLIDKLQLPFDQLSIQQALQRFADSLQTANGLYKKDYRLMLKVHLLNTLKLSVRHSLPLFIAFFLQIDIRPQDIPLFFSASFFVDLILSALPVYGKHGVAETTFTLIFTPLVTAAQAASIMLVWRAITFYTNTVLGGICMLLSPDISRSSLKKIKQNTEISA